jgi:hypothetical protein
MGLDMYLEAKLYLSEYSGDKELFEKAYELVPYKYPNSFKNVTLEFPVGYWRKVNWIHKWFVDNVQGGNDNCESYYVDLPMLEELRDLVSDLLDKKDIDQALKDLPPQSGFFFGTTEIDSDTEKWYWDSLDQTKDILTQAIKLESSGCIIYYRANW